MGHLWHILSLCVIVVLCRPASSRSTGVQKRSSVCYDDLGCFSTGAPFFSTYRPVNFLPDRPEKINTRFQLFTRTTKTNGQYISANNFNSITGSPFSGSRPTKIISHGFLEGGNADWLHDMKNEFLKAGDFNVIIVGWGGGSGLPYTQATANTRVVGAEIAKLIKVLQNHGGAHTEDIHVIGHSLGAHIAGYAGERTQNLGRITGLDPADPYFQYTDKAVRLDPTDAMFVDVIHTDAESILKLGFGMMQACGHVDYYPNRGEDQPGCEKGVVDQIRLEGDLYNGGKEYVACNHLRSYKYFTESINSVCPWMGYHCETYDGFKRGECMPCTGNGCGQMGYHADLHKPNPGQTLVKYYLDTGSVGPFCRYHYLFRITFGNPSGARSWTGKLYGNIHGSNGQLGQTILSDTNVNVQPGKSYGFVVISPHDVGTISDASINWQHERNLLNPLSWNPFNLRHPTVFVSNVEVVNGETHHRVNFCGSNTHGIDTQQTMRFATKC